MTLHNTRQPRFVGLKAIMNPDASARAAERQRIASVFAAQEVRGREMSAALMLAETDLPAGSIIKLLTGLPITAKAQADARQCVLDAAANRKGNGPRQNFGWGKIHAKAAGRRV